MKTLCLLVFTLALAVAAAPEMGAQARSLQKMSPNTSNQILHMNELQESGEDVVIAIVKSIDRKHGLMYLDSEIGQILTFATPAELQALHAGDLVVMLHVIGEDLDDNLVQDTIIA